MKIFVNGPAKSGTHLGTRLLELAGFRDSRLCLAMELARRAAVPWRREQEAGLGQPLLLGLEFPTPIHELLLRQTLRSLPNHALCNGHSPYSDELARLLHSEGVRVLAMERDLGDTAVSLARYLTNVGHPDFQGIALSQALDQVLTGYTATHQGEPQPLRRNNLVEIARLARRWGESGAALAVRFEDLIGPEGGGDLQVQRETLLRIFSYFSIENIDLESIRQQLFGNTVTFYRGHIGEWERCASQQQKQQLNAMAQAAGLDLHA